MSTTDRTSARKRKSTEGGYALAAKSSPEILSSPASCTSEKRVHRPTEDQYAQGVSRGLPVSTDVVEQALQTPDLAAKIFQYLDAEDRLRFMRVSSFWRDMMASPVVQRIARFRALGHGESDDYPEHNQLLSSLFASGHLDTLVIDLKMGDLEIYSDTLVGEINARPRNNRRRRIVFVGGSMHAHLLSEVRLNRAPSLFFHKVSVEISIEDCEFELDYIEKTVFVEKGRLNFTAQPENLKICYEKPTIIGQLIDFLMKFLVLKPMEKEQVDFLQNIFSAEILDADELEERYEKLGEVLLRLDPNFYREEADYRHLQLTDLRPITLALIKQIWDEDSEQEEEVDDFDEDSDEWEDDNGEDEGE